MLIYNDDKILLGRQKVWPSGMYSTRAGFVETGETIEIFQKPKSEYTKTLIRAIPTVTDEEDATKP